MACEVPVVVTDTAGYREVVDDGVTGIILKDREPETMAKSIIRLLKDTNLAKQFGINGRQRVLKYYDWQSSVFIMEKLYVNTINECKR